MSLIDDCGVCHVGGPLLVAACKAAFLVMMVWGGSSGKSILFVWTGVGTVCVTVVVCVDCLVAAAGPGGHFITFVTSVVSVSWTLWTTYE